MNRFTIVAHASLEAIMKTHIDDVSKIDNHELSHNYISDDNHEKYEALKMIGNIILMVLLIGLVAMAIDQVINFVYFNLLTFIA